MKQLDHVEISRVKASLKRDCELRPSETTMLMDYIHELETALLTLSQQVQIAQSVEPIIREKYERLWLNIIACKLPLKRSLYNGCSLNEDDAQEVADYVASLEDLLDKSDDHNVHNAEMWRSRLSGSIGE